jgi:23S rRNA (guanine2535-N1)-methyltransferase
MPYEFTTERQDYTDLSSGRVLYNHPGFPVLPVRLASEILERCLALRKVGGDDSPCRIFDPCCGSAYHLTALAFLYGSQISHIAASDIDPVSSSLAARNLGLLTASGLDQRIAELQKMLDLYHKESHMQAIASANQLRKKLDCSRHGEARWISTSVMTANALSDNINILLEGRGIDILITDIPYGLHSDWLGLPASRPGFLPVQCLLENLLPAASARSILAVCADKGQKITHEGYKKIDRFQVGKRQVVLLKKC